MNLVKIGEKNPNFGKVHSVESKAKMNVARKITIFVYSENNIFVNNFSFTRVARVFFNTHRKTILKYLRSSKIFKEKWILSLFKK